MPTIADHLRSPDITIDTHERRSRIALGEALAQRHAIYLDTKYWILLRDANKGTSRSGALELLRLLREGTANGRLFCPISESVFVELMKQSDPTSRLAMAALIDELSLGATLIGQEARVATEISHFIHAKTGRTNLHPLKHLVWSKLSYVLGTFYPKNTGYDPTTEGAIQKAFFDHMWALPFREMVIQIGDGEMDEANPSEFTTALNNGVTSNADGLRSFEQAYSAEVRGIVDIVGDGIPDVLASMARNEGVVLNEPTAEERRASINGFKNLFAIALEKDKARNELRTMHILSSLHASLRWNKRRKFKDNDLLDFDHAAAALAYADAFFTERSLCAMVTERRLALDRLYGCRVTALVDDAIAWTQRAVKG